MGLGAIYKFDFNNQQLAWCAAAARVVYFAVGARRRRQMELQTESSGALPARQKSILPAGERELGSRLGNAP
jgi:hypothetical protein